MSEVSLDPAVLAFTIAIAVVTSILCGLAPALRASRVDLSDVLKAGTRSSATTGARRLRDTFVITQFALSLVLLVGAGLLLRSYRHLLEVDPGYRTRNVLVARLTAPYPRYDDAAVRRFYGQLLDRVGTVRGLRRVGLASRVPLTSNNPQNNLVAEGREPKSGQPVLVANIRSVSPGYFDAIGTPLLQGRLFVPTDDERHPRVAVVDETLARHFWPTESALGKRIRYQGDTSATSWMTIVGIVRNVKHNRLDEKPDLQVYEPFARSPWRSSYVVVRTDVVPPEAIVAQLRREVAALDATIPLFEVHTMQSALDESLSTRRLTNLLLAAFAGAALVLAAIGIYGVISLSVTARLKEFGIRLALGARSGDVTRLVLRQGMLLAMVGVTIGLAGALSVTRFLRVLLFGVQPLDWPTFSAVALLLTATALVACWIPARRAMRSDPIEVLRTE
jgi:predicted permease